MQFMTTSAVIVLVVAVILLAAVGWVLYRQQRRKGLRARFGPEYPAAVRQYGNEWRADEALAARERRMEKIPIRALSREDHQRFADQWQAVQRDFVDDPAGSIQRADALVSEVLRARGYPRSDFEHRAEDISVDHPEVVQKFRLAHAIAERHSRGQAGTEDLRQAVIYYRDLFDDLLETHTTGERTNKR
jgi:hypothetical protein